jgi:hypothetical protein
MSDPIDPLLALIREHSWTPCRKVLTCAPDVEQQLQKTASPIGPSEDTVLMSLTGVDVVVAEDSPPGSWRMVRHDHCQVIHPAGASEPSRAWVSHQDCTIIGGSS